MESITTTTTTPTTTGNLLHRSSDNASLESSSSSFREDEFTPPTSQRSTDDSFVSSLSSASVHSTSTLSISDLQPSSFELMTDTGSEDMEAPSSSNLEEASMQEVDLEEDEFPPYQCHGSTQQAVYSNASKQDKRRHRRRVKPQTPKEQYCGGCCGSNDNYHLDYDPNDDQVEFEGDSCPTQVLRYCRLLPPRPDERLIKRKIRFLLWWTILLDFIVALVALLSFGPAMTCCGEPIFAIPGMDIYQVIQIVLYVYLGVVILQILPVVREGCIPWNLMNPLFGFAFGFVLFWNDAPMAALCVWILDIVSVALEFVTLRHYSILLKEAKQRMDQAEQAQHNNHRKSSSRYKEGYYQSKQERNQHELRRRHTKALYRWRKHMIGVSINVLLVIATLWTIVRVARTGGMCVQDGGTSSLFGDSNSMECSNASDGRRYETCDLELGESECYFPFF